jgi:dextranase
MKTGLWAALAFFLLMGCQGAQAQESISPTITDVFTDKARYAPGELVSIEVDLKNSPGTPESHAALDLSFFHLGEEIGSGVVRDLTVTGQQPVLFSIQWLPPTRDYTGYFVDVRLLNSQGKELDRSQTAIDVSTEWNRFPRYGYLAHYSKTEGADPDLWIAELNKFHIDGLEYYDFQDRHEHPLAGTVQDPAPRWYDIADREIDRDILSEFLNGAHSRNMMSMAYDTSYSAYASAFSDGSGVQLKWATWDTPNAPRTIANAKALDLPANTAWETPRLIYMNQNSPEWQDYLFGQMANLFLVYPFDGWHIDTFGTKGAYAYAGSYINFIAGFRPFIENAKNYLNKRIVLNTVNTWGQDGTAQSSADFVYSELWEGHETYASILAVADQVHTANPDVGLVLAAYLHRRDTKSATTSGKRQFNLPSVLLADAVIFASGASHIELGDGSRMLSSEYFPADTTYSVSPTLYSSLRRYYDFLTAYENVLRYRVTPSAARAVVQGYPSNSTGVPNTIWTIARQEENQTIIHFINLLGSDDPHWRDINADRPDAPLLSKVKVRVYSDAKISSAEWATPDADGGRLHPLNFQSGDQDGRTYIDIVLPSLKYWDMVLLRND